MKKNILYLIFVCLLLITITGCSKKSEIEETQNVAENNFEQKSEEKTNEDITSEDRVNEDEASEEKASEDKVSEDKASEDKASEDKVSEDKTNEDKTSKDEVNKDQVQEDKIEGSTSNEQLDVDQIALGEDTIKIQGNVGNATQLTLKDLKSMNDLLFEADFFSINTFGTRGYTHFKGINLWKLLEEKAQISDDASSVSIVATDGYEMEFTIEQIKKQDYIDEQNPEAFYPMIIAWEENGKEYDEGDGAPFKLVVGQKEVGDVNKPQWVSNIDKIIIK